MLLLRTPLWISSMSNEEARAVAYAINRYVRRRRIGEGGRSFGVDYVTWHICHPQLSAAFNAAIEVLTGRAGKYVPVSLTGRPAPYVPLALRG